ncbi:MAG: hypothetical protein U0235_24095 [Polyangiaceae bacterium]
MDSELVQRTRYQLQARVRHAKACPVLLFQNATKHLLAWVEQHPLLKALLAPLEPAANAYQERIVADLAKLNTPAVKEISGPWEPSTREDATALALAGLRAIQGHDLGSRAGHEGYVIALVVAGYDPEKRHTSEGIVEALRDVAIQGLYEYLDEQIDGRNAVLGLLVKYKSRCEMYRRARLREAATEGLEGRTGERALAFDLYEYLHDQGVDFWIESVSASGEPDLISRDVRGQRLVADAKYIDDRGKVRRTITSGFRQVLDYCRDHNESVGYLVLFVNTDLIVDLKGDRDDGFPCFRTGGYTVYYVVIDIHDHGTTASKRPKPPVAEFVAADLMVSVDEEQSESSVGVPTVAGS